MQNNYLPYQNVEGEDSSMMCKAFIFGKKLLLTIRCTTHFNDANTFIATQRVKEPTVYVQSQYNFSIMSYMGL